MPGWGVPEDEYLQELEPTSDAAIKRFGVIRPYFDRSRAVSACRIKLNLRALSHSYFFGMYVLAHGYLRGREWQQ